MGSTVGESLSSVVGWAYFFCWSISFYPQLITNYKRKSVEGLSFDFLLYNTLGFLCYSTYNCAFYFSQTVKDLYNDDHDGTYPVQLNDVVFSLHAEAITLLSVFQAIYYKTESSDNSRLALGIVSVQVSSILLVGTLWLTDEVDVLFFLYWCSYVKVSITLIKYMPQIYINYKFKTTEGWSTGNTILDASGGLLSILQMFIDSVDGESFEVFIGDPAKLCLGLLSLTFDLILLVQRFLFYPPTENPISQVETESTSSYVKLNDQASQSDFFDHKNE